MTHDAFISHSTKDKQVADAICSHLERSGINCWMAPRNIRPGDDWAEAIVSAIANSKLVIFIFSSNSNDSSQINREINITAEEGIPILPFRIEDIQPSQKLRYYLSTPHWLNALPPPIENHFEDLVRSVRMFLPAAPETKSQTGQRPTAPLDLSGFNKGQASEKPASSQSASGHENYHQTPLNLHSQPPPHQPTGPREPANTFTGAQSGNYTNSAGKVGQGASSGPLTSGFPPAGGRIENISTYIVLSIIGLFLCGPLGLVSLILSVLTMQHKGAGKYELAVRYSGYAKVSVIFTYIVGIIGTILVILLNLKTLR
jgi:hypothetical protein